MACQGLFAVHTVRSPEELKILLASSLRAQRNLAQQVRYYKKKYAALHHETRRCIQALLQLTYSALAEIVIEWDYQLKNQELDEQMRKGRMELLLDKHLGNEKDLGIIGKVVNLAFDQVLDQMQREEKVVFSTRDKKLYCYMVTRMADESVRILMKLNCASTAGTQKYRLKQRIGHHTVKGRKEYLDLLDKKNK